MTSRADGSIEHPEDGEDDSDGYQDQADRPQDAGAEDEAENQTDDAEHDHTCLRSVVESTVPALSPAETAPASTVVTSGAAGFLARRKVRLAVLGRAARDRAATGDLCVEFPSEEDREVREPQPDEEDHDGTQAPVGLVVRAELRDVDG